MRQLVIVPILIAAMSAFGQESSSQKNAQPDNQDGATVQTTQTEDQDQEQDNPEDNAKCSEALTWCSPLVIVQSLWMALIAAGAPLYSKCAAPKDNKDKLRGLNMPSGSIRGILALLAVGSFVNVLVLGGPVLEDKFGNYSPPFAS